MCLLTSSDRPQKVYIVMEGERGSEWCFSGPLALKKLVLQPFSAESSVYIQGQILGGPTT